MQKIGKEIKIGLAVIGVLVAAFGYILFRKLTRPEDLAAAPPASTAPSATATAANTTDKPTVVAATDSGRPADAATDGASSSRSLFASTRRVQASETTDPGADSHGSFMPAANNTLFTNPAPANPVPANSAPANSAPASSGTVADSATIVPPENRFSQFGHNNDASSAATGAATGSAPAADTTGNAAPKTHKAHDGNHSLFTSGATAPAADATAAPSTIGSAAASSDPFAQKSAASDSPAATAPAAVSSVATQAPGLMPVDPSAAQQAAPSDSQDGNPLRHSHDGQARPTSATSPDAVSSEAPRSMFAATSSNAPMANSSRPYSANPNVADALGAPPDARPAYPSAQAPPPPITPNAISVPSAQLAPPEPVSAVQPLAADNGAHRPGQYIVQPNDNYWTISEKVYGTGGYFKAIYEHNRRQHSQSDRLQVGDSLDVPDVAVLQQAYPDLCPKSDHDTAPVQPTSAVAAAPPGTRSYAVADGDTLYEIARRELGRASRWGEIYQLNHDQLGNDFGYLRPGTQLLLPSDSSAPSVAREPSSVLQR